MKRRAREGIEQGAYYPEPAWITASRRRAFWYRLLLGRPMDGQRWSDSTFWRSATRGEDHWWLRLAGWQRALTRVTGLYFICVLTPVLLLLHAMRMKDLLIQLLLFHVLTWSCVLLPVLTYRLLRGRSQRKWEREVVIPVARTAAARLNRRFHPREVSQWVSVPRDYREPDGQPVEISLPGHFVLNETARRALVKAVGERLGVKDPEAEWQMEGAHPRLVLRAPVLPPELVTFEDMLPFLLAAERSEQTGEYGEGTFVLGVAGKESFSVSLGDDSPHLALSAGSGGGKSELIKTLIAQALRWGWFVLILDWKGESQEWAEELPGVRYVRRIEQLHDTCVDIGEEVEWRTAHRSEQEKAERIPLLVVSEEWGVTAPLLADYWSNLRATAEPEERKTMPLKSPAAQALMKLNFTGRSMHMHQLLIAQRFSARVTNGNADLRESFTAIFMTRWKSQTMKMLAPDLKPVPKKLTKPGQWLAVIGDMAVRFQGGLWTDDEAREWALGGKSNPASPWVTRRSHRPMTQRMDVETLEHAGLHNLLGHDPTRPYEITSRRSTSEVTRRLRRLSDIADDLSDLGVTKNVLDMWRKNDKEGFPKEQGGSPNAGWLYDHSEIEMYARRKRAAQAAEKG